MTPAERQRAYRARKGAGTTRGPAPTQPHGTLAAARRHERAGEPLCEPCRAARNAAARRYYESRKRCS